MGRTSRELMLTILGSTAARRPHPDGVKCARAPPPARVASRAMSTYRPELTVRERAGSVRLHLGSLAHGDGLSLQAAAEDLLQRVLAIGRAFRTSGFSVSPEAPFDVAALSFVCELDEIAAAGGDVRSRLFGP